MRLRHPCPLPLSAWQSEIAIGNRDGIRPNRLNPIVLPWQSRWNRRFDRIIGNTVFRSCGSARSRPREPYSNTKLRKCLCAVHFKHSFIHTTGSYDLVCQCGSSSYEFPFPHIEPDVGGCYQFLDCPSPFEPFTGFKRP